MKFINLILIAVLSISIFILGCAYTKLYTYPEWLALREDDTGGEGAEGDGGYWIQIGNDIYYNTGNVGIGTTNPTALLEVNGNVKIGAYTLPSTDGTADQVLKTNGAGVLNWANDIGGGIGDDLGSHTATSNIILGTNFLSGDGGNEGIQIGADGTVTATTLNINSVYTFPVADGTSGYVLKTDGSGNVTWQTDNAGTGGDNLGDHTATGNIILGTNYLSGDGGNEGIQIGADGTVTATILNVNSAYTLPTADGTNSQVLQTNGSGTVSWATISGSSLWTDAGTYNYSNNATNVVITDSGNVGIGMAGPNAKLEIDMASLTTTEGLRITRSAAASHYAYMSIEDESSNPIFVVVEDGSVGIGTSTPNGLVQISAGGGGTTALILGANLDIDTPATESLRIGAGGTEHMVIEAGGNIGVGTTTPGTKLDVAGTIKATGFQLGTSTTAGYVLTANASGVGTWQATGAGSGLWTDGGAYNYSNNATNVVVTDTGRVGIGTTTPSQLLDVAGNIALSTGGKIYGDTTTTYINLSDTNGSMLGYGDSTVYVANDIAFTTATIDRMTILNTGEVGIGTSTPSQMLEVAGNIEVMEGAYIRTPSNLPYVYLDDSNGSVLGYDDCGIYAGFDTVKFFTTATDRMVITTNGDVGIGTPSPSAILDVNGATGYDQLRLRTAYTPTGSADANGNIGDIAWDDGFIYVKTSAGWKRSSLVAF